VARILTAVVLPAPLGPRSPEDRAARHFEVDPVERGHVAEALDESVCCDRVLVHPERLSQVFQIRQVLSIMNIR
jgi:hypothetical protein